MEQQRVEGKLSTCEQFSIGPYTFTSKVENRYTVWKGTEQIGASIRPICGKILPRNDPEILKSHGLVDDDIVRVYAIVDLPRDLWPNPQSEVPFQVLVLEWIEKTQQIFESKYTQTAPANKHIFKTRTGAAITIHTDAHNLSFYASHQPSWSLAKDTNGYPFATFRRGLFRSNENVIDFLIAFAQGLSSIHTKLSALLPDMTPNFHAHEDPNPSNVLVKTATDGSITIKIIDLGRLDEQGHPNWTSPEHFSQSITSKSDMFIFGLYAIRIFIASRNTPKLSPISFVREIALQCLEPEIANRPTSDQVLALLKTYKSKRSRSMLSFGRLAAATGIALSILFLYAALQPDLLSSPEYSKYAPDNGLTFIEDLNANTNISPRVYRQTLLNMIEFDSLNNNSFSELRENAIHALAGHKKGLAPVPTNFLESRITAIFWGGSHTSVIFNDPSFAEEPWIQLGSWIDSNYYFHSARIPLSYSEWVKDQDFTLKFETIDSSEQTKRIPNPMIPWDPDERKLFFAYEIPITHILNYLSNATNIPINTNRVMTPIYGAFNYTTYEDLLSQILSISRQTKVGLEGQPINIDPVTDDCIIAWTWHMLPSQRTLATLIQNTVDRSNISCDEDLDSFKNLSLNSDHVQGHSWQAVLDRELEPLGLSYRIVLTRAKDKDLEYFPGKYELQLTLRH